MTRPEIDLVIPVQADSEQLARSVALLEKHTENFRLHVVREPDLNVSEARQKALDEIVKSRFVCFLDDDSEMLHPGWLDAMCATMLRRPDAGAVFGRWLSGTDIHAAIDAHGIHGHDFRIHALSQDEAHRALAAGGGAD